jgi:hypothetical protein
MQYCVYKNPQFDRIMGYLIRIFSSNFSINFIDSCAL